MRELGPTVMLLMSLLLAACGDDADAPAASDIATPAQGQPAVPAAPTDAIAAVPLRQSPEGLLAAPALPPGATGAPTARTTRIGWPKSTSQPSVRRTISKPSELAITIGVTRLLALAAK